MEKELKNYLKADYDFKNTQVFYFAFIWNLFESICCKTNCNYQKLENLSKDSVLSNLSSLDTIYDYFKSACKLDQTEECFLFPEKPFKFSFFSTKSPSEDESKNELSFRNNDEEKWEKTKEIFKNTNSSNSEKLKAILYIAYRVRNNFFHGAKDLQSIKYQDTIFMHLNKLLLEIVMKKKPNYDSN